MSEKVENGTGNPRYRMGPVARALAAEFAGSEEINQQHLEAGILDLQAQINRAQQQGSDLSEGKLEEELDALLVEVNGKIETAFGEIRAVQTIHTHTLNLVRDMLGYYGEAVGNADLTGMLAEMNERLDREITSIRETQRFREERRAQQSTEKSNTDDREREADEQDQQNADVANPSREVEAGSPHHAIGEAQREPDDHEQQLAMEGMDDEHER